MPPRAGGLYYEPFYRFVRAELAAARDPTFAGTVVAARALVELGDERGDDQALVPTLAGAAWMLVRVGEQDEAGTLLDRLLERRRSNRLGFSAGWWSMYAALALERMGRTGTLAALGERPGSAFLAAALEIDAARFPTPPRRSGRSGRRSSRPRRGSSRHVPPTRSEAMAVPAWSSKGRGRC